MVSLNWTHLACLLPDVELIMKHIQSVRVFLTCYVRNNNLDSLGSLLELRRR